MVVGLLKLDIFIPESQSLKEKRQVIKSLTSKIRAKFNASVCEVEHQDLWQRAVLAIAVVAQCGGRASELVDTISSFVEKQDLEMLIIDTHADLIHAADFED